MTHLPYDLTRFDNSDPGTLTILLIGSEDHIHRFILTQHRENIIPADAWSKALPVPNCPGKVMRIFRLRRKCFAPTPGC